MKRVFLVGLMVCVFLAGFIWSQVEQKPYTYKFDKDVGDCLFTGVSKDAVWSAALKTLMLMKFQILSAEKESGTISAMKTLSGFQSTMGVGSKSMPELDLVFEERDDGIAILSTVIAGINWPSKNRRDLEKKFYEKVAALLYKPAEN